MVRVMDKQKIKYVANDDAFKAKARAHQFAFLRKCIKRLL